MRRSFYCREKRRTRRIRYSIITSLAALAISAATGFSSTLVSAAGNLAGTL